MCYNNLYLQSHAHKHGKLVSVYLSTCVRQAEIKSENKNYFNPETEQTEGWRFIVHFSNNIEKYNMQR